MDSMFLNIFPDINITGVMIFFKVVYISILLGFFFYLKNIIHQYITFYLFRSNVYVSIGDSIIYTTESLVLEMKIHAITSKRIILKNDEHTVVIPLKKFYERDWIFCKK